MGHGCRYEHVIPVAEGKIHPHDLLNQGASWNYNKGRLGDGSGPLAGVSGEPVHAIIPAHRRAEVVELVDTRS